jgi:hypothetical protein
MRGIAIVVAAVCGLALAACGDSDGSSAPDIRTVPPAASVSSTTVRADATIPADPCVFLKPAELRPIFDVAFDAAGKPVSSRDGLVGCSVEGPNGEYLFVEVDQTRRSESDLFAKCEPSAPEEAERYQPITGLATKAGVKNGLPQLCVLERGVLFKVTYTPERADPVKNLSQTRSLAQAIIAQL